MTTTQRRAKFTLILIIAAALGAGLGLGVRKSLLSSNEQKKKEARDSLTASRLSESNDLEAGKRIGDHSFETLEGDTISLYRAVQSPGMVMVIHPECPSCIDELVRLQASGISQSRMSSIAFISFANPRLIQDLWRDLGLDFRVLYDHRAEWSKSHNVQDFPLVVRFDQDWIIQDVFIGGLLEDEVAALRQ